MEQELKSNTCSLYWIHLKEQTDFLSEGYIGITKNDPAQRLTQHRAAAFRYLRAGKYLSPLKQILISNPDNLIVETLVIGSHDYISDLERKIRPTRFIGWNLARGGQTPEDLYIKTGGSEYCKSQLKKYLEEHGHYATHRNPWELLPRSSPVSKRVWLLSDIIYNNRTETATTLTKLLGISKTGRNDSIRNVLLKISEGWNPETDVDWLNFVESNSIERDEAVSKMPNTYNKRTSSRLSDTELSEIFEVWSKASSKSPLGAVGLNKLLPKYSINRLDTAIRKFKLIQNLGDTHE